MIRMVDAINTENFGGVPRVTCFTCHQGAPSPKSATSLDVQYGVPPDDPNEIIFPVEPISALPSPDELFEKYIGALGGREQMENLTSFVARGTYSGYDTNLIEVPVEVFAAAPGRRTTVVQALFGESVRDVRREYWVDRLRGSAVAADGAYRRPSGRCPDGCDSVLPC